MISSSGKPFLLPGGPFGCLLIHDFASAPQETCWLGTQLNEAGFTVLAIRLSGHGTISTDLKRARFSDWIACVEDGFTILRHQCDKLVAIGISMGGALGLIASVKCGIDGVVAISTPYNIPPISNNKSLRVLMLLMQFIGLGQRPILKTPFSDKLGALFTPERLSYPSVPPRVILEVNELFKEMQRILPNVSIPALLIEADSARNGDTPQTTEILDHLTTKRTKVLRIRQSDSKDVMLQEQERITSAIIRFVAGLSGFQL
jgi:carboxylesterase